MSPTLTLYTAKVCPFAHRVELALAEAKADVIQQQIDLKNKPEWYPKVNPVGKVPAIAYGGPVVPADQPSPESTKIAESLVLLEFVADLYPESGLLPKDPVARAKVRFFIDTISTKFVTSWGGFVFRKQPIEELYKAVEALQDLLPGTGFAVGNNFTIADAAILPFVVRFVTMLQSNVSLFSEEQAKEILETFTNDARFEQFRNYIDGLKERESFKSTYDVGALKAYYAIQWPRVAN